MYLIPKLGLKAQTSRKYFDSCQWCADASWKLVPGVFPLWLPLLFFPQSTNHRVLNTVWRTLLPTAILWDSMQGRRLQTKQGEKREGAAGRGAHHLSTKHSGWSFFPCSILAGWAGSAARIFWQWRALSSKSSPYLAAPSQRWGDSQGVSPFFFF